MMKKYMIIVSLLMAWTTSLLAENSTLPLTVIPGTDGSVHLVSAVPAEVTGSVISKGFEYRLKGAGAWTTVSVAGAFEADIAVPVGTHEFRVFAEVSGQGTLYSRTNQVMVVGGYDNNAGTVTCTVDETPIAAAAAAGTYQIAVNCNGAWTAVVEDAGNHAWCTLTGASGTNNGVITVNVAENPFFTTRSATVKITVGDLTKYVVITQEGANTEPCTLNTKWKCEGIVNVETGVLTELAAKECNNFIRDCEKVCYTLTFDPNNVAPWLNFDGRGVSNTFFGQCEIDCTTNNFQVVMYGMSSVAPHCDEKLYLELLLSKVNKFSPQKNKLRLYFDEHNYLLFKPLEP